ncbi:unnamed protein product [Lactuca virosa]|uniref:Uncharacterized protein n=1 Tax=Lactuca virosa TaxID=75947 RepID=A0AAU9N7M8_9ASTR|nr:unnamed protein product [Lactuca virosa]
MRGIILSYFGDPAVGQSSRSRMRAASNKMGIEITSISRQISPSEAMLQCYCSCSSTAFIENHVLRTSG